MLDVYGDHMMTPYVRRYLACLTVVIAFAFVIDWYLWRLVILAALDAKVAAFIGGFMMAGMVAILEWTVATFDTTENQKKNRLLVAGRVVLMSVMAVFTATMLHLNFFHAEIFGLIAREEKVGADAAEQVVIEAIADDYAARIAAKEAAISGEPEAVKTSRDARRVEMLENQKTQRAQRNAEVAAAQRTVDALSRRSGRRGQANAGLVEANATLAAAIKSRSEFEAAATAERTAFEAAAEQAIGGAQTMVEHEKDKLIADRDADIVAVRELSQEEFGRLYPGDWVRSRGIMDQYRALAKIAAADVTNLVVSIALWVLGMLPPGMLLLLKFYAPEDVRRYFSLKVQAAEGEGDAKDRLAKRGFSGDLSRLGASADALAHLDAVDVTRVAARDALIKFDAWMMEQCAPSETSRVSWGRAVLTRRAVTHWRVHVEDALRAARDAEERARRNGVTIDSSWPSDWEVSAPPGPDDRPWLRSNQDLARYYGWVDPEASTGPRIVGRS